MSFGRCGTNLAILLSTYLPSVRTVFMENEQTLPMSYVPQSEAVDHLLPATIGPYRVIRLIGEGGMGAVYEAEQQQPRRTVALKVIKTAIASPDLIRRFQQESQALARLHHAGIAQVYDAGSAETGFGRQPYFAMELIQGQVLTDYALTTHLGTRARLQLICKVCEAVHHAHQRGIIHRDLKPGNILVDETGQPKILDFGIARLTAADAEDSTRTGVGQVIGTLAYMSPEQVLANPNEIDTRTDVYSLGVISYELLSGRLPYNFGTKGLQESLHTICEESPSPLSSINRVYKGDIETIVAKALEKDKNRRYASAAELSADIGRYLDDQPIVARPPSAAYYLKKLAHRHRALMAGIAAVFFVLAAGLVASSWQAVRATRAEKSAELQRDRAATAEQLATRERDRAVAAESTAAGERDKAVASGIIATRERDRAVAEKLRADSETATAGAINSFLQNDLLAQADSEAQANADNKPDPDMRVRTVLDRAALRVAGKFSGKPDVEASIESTIGKTYEGLGILADAQHHYEKALKLRESSLGEHHPASLKAATELGGLYRVQGKYPQAESLLQKTVDRYRALPALPPQERIKAMDELSTVLTAEAKFPQAESLLNEALQSTHRALPPSHPASLNLMLSLTGLYFRQGRFAAAEPLLNEVLDIRTQTLGPEHPVTLSTRNNLGVLYQREGKFAQAEPLLFSVMQTNQRMKGPNHIETLNALNNLAVMYAAQGKDSEAEGLYTRVLEGWRGQLGPEHPRTLSLMYNLGALYAGQGNFTDAEAMLHDCWVHRKTLLGPEHPDTLTAGSYLGEVYRLQRNFAAAETLLTQVVDTRRRVTGAAHPETAHALTGLAVLRLQQQRYRDAELLSRESLNILLAKTPEAFRRFRAEASLGASLAAQSKFAEAEPLLISGYIGMNGKAAGSIEKSRASNAAGWLVRMYESWGKPVLANQWRPATLASRTDH